MTKLTGNIRYFSTLWIGKGSGHAQTKFDYGSLVRGEGGTDQQINPCIYKF